MTTNYFNFDISEEASVFTTAFYIVGYSNYLKKLMRNDPNVLPNYSSLLILNLINSLHSSISVNLIFEYFLPFLYITNLVIIILFCPDIR